MPSALRNCTLVPIPKPHKDPSLSDSYRPIALAPNLSKVLESCILMQYHHCFVTFNLQFGFKQGFSTSLCTSVLKNVVSKYIHRGSRVYSCFLDASKAFDRVNHKLLLRLLLKRNVPTPILRFLFSWYQSQTLSVRWNSTLSSGFGVTNGKEESSHLFFLLSTLTSFLLVFVQLGRWLFHRLSLCWCMLLATRMTLHCWLHLHLLCACCSRNARFFLENMISFLMPTKHNWSVFGLSLIWCYQTACSDSLGILFASLTQLFTLVMFFSLTLTIWLTSIAFPRICVAKQTFYFTSSSPAILLSKRFCSQLTVSLCMVQFHGIWLTSNWVHLKLLSIIYSGRFGICLCSATPAFYIVSPKHPVFLTALFTYSRLAISRPVLTAVPWSDIVTLSRHVLCTLLLDTTGGTSRTL